MSFSVLSLIIVLLIGIYEKGRRPRVCENKIKVHIYKLGGTIIEIKKLTERDEVYHVKYIINEDEKSSVVKFNLLYKDTWE